VDAVSRDFAVFIGFVPPQVVISIIDRGSTCSMGGPMVERVGGIFDYRDWADRRAAKVGVRRALDEAVLVFGRAMVRGFVLACVPRWPPVAEDADLVDDEDRLPPIHVPEQRGAWRHILHVGGFFWVWERHANHRAEMASAWRGIRLALEAERRVSRPNRHDMEWTVPFLLRGPSNDDIFDAIVAEDAAILRDVVRPAIPWSLVHPGLVALEADATALEAGMPSDVLSDGPLWICAERPNGWPESWSRGCDLLRTAEPGWEASLAWIDRRLRGEPMDAATDAALFGRVWTYG
jgi:hypothetical protein